jgi:hypothetical protein
MARISRNPKGQGLKPHQSIFWKIGAVLMLVAAYRVFDCSFAASDNYNHNLVALQGLENKSTAKKTLSSSLNLPQDETCQQLPQIRADGVFFLNPKIKGADSPPEVNLSFRIGTMLEPSVVSRHMTADLAHYALLKQHFSSQQSQNMGIALDVGANQGFFTYFLATYGFTVHAFEINPNNFDSLQHGRYYNPNAIADRVHLYPMGMADTVHRMSAAGQNYEGFLKASQEREPYKS